ncbi:hypothetical protein HU734_021500 [Pseudomonas wayambapalatensis]|nr:hypothetical protein HU734_021500 [Pseudomonas wayambapalatensis]
MTYEPTSKGNEFQLTINQHFHMEAILRKFAADDKKVAVTDKVSGSTERFSVENRRFKAKRAWSQEIEQHISWPIEAAFILEVQRIEDGGIVEDQKAISAYHLLWVLRHSFALNPSSARTLIPGMPLGQMDKRLEEFAESLGKLPLSGGQAAGRFATTLDIKACLNEPHNKANYDGIYWQVLRSDTTRFISADSYPSKLLVPIGPQILLKGCREASDAMLIDTTQVEKFNKVAIGEATNFTFG